MSGSSSIVDTAGFRRAVSKQARPTDLTAIMAVALVLVGLFALEPTTQRSLVFETGQPTLRAAYFAHFVHRQQFHLLGNVLVYLVVVPVTYLLCILGGRRQLFRVTFVMLFSIFPLVLSLMQLLFPRQREVLGFSGINAGFFGLLCVAWALYTGRHFFDEPSPRYAPALLFAVAGAVALITLPARAWRLEIAAASLALSLGYLAAWLASSGRPTPAAIHEGFDRFGYAELAGAGFGLIVSYPFIGFRAVVTVETGVLDVYIHLLGFALTFMIVYAYEMLVEG